MSRHSDIIAGIRRGYADGTIAGWYIQNQMPGRRWTVWGTAVGAYEYCGATGISIDRSYTTREVEAMLRHAGLLDDPDRMTGFKESTDPC